jgi:hypothetical protein
MTSLTVRRIARILGVASIAALPFGVIEAAGAESAIVATSPPSASDWREIRRLITAQREALIAGQGDHAASFATAPIRRQFLDGAGFLRMVREGYAPLITARYTEFLEGAVIEGTTVQPLRLVLPDDSVLVALYSVDRQKDGSWRIAGCVIAPSTVIAA